MKKKAPVNATVKGSVSQSYFSVRTGIIMERNPIHGLRFLVTCPPIRCSTGTRKWVPGRCKHRTGVDVCCPAYLSGLQRPTGDLGGLLYSAGNPTRTRAMFA